MGGTGSVETSTSFTIWRLITQPLELWLVIAVRVCPFFLISYLLRQSLLVVAGPPPPPPQLLFDPPERKRLVYLLVDIRVSIYQV